MKTHYEVIVVGGGQAGLSISYCLTKRGVDHIVLERSEVAHAWKNERWDNFHLVTPNWQCQLPGFAYQGSDPKGFMRRDEIVEYVKSYAKSFDAPVREGVEVTRVSKNPLLGTFDVECSLGSLTADAVVIAIGGFHAPRIPEAAKQLPASVQQLHSSEYKNPESLPEGEVLVVGSGQSGCQIAEDLHLAGRRVHLVLGDAPRSPRMYRGKDVVEWLDEFNYYDIPIDAHPDIEMVRDKTNHYLTGRDGGREIDLRQFALQGMQLYGFLEGMNGAELAFAPDLSERLDAADAVYNGIRKLIDEYIEKNNIAAPAEAPYVPPWKPEQEPRQLNLVESGVTSVVWCIGFRHNFDFIDCPVFTERGYPRYQRGVSDEAGLYFLGLSWLYTWGSGRFSGVAQDARYLAEQIDARRGQPEVRAASSVA